MPIDYTKPSAVKQMVGRTRREQQTLDRRIEQAGREAGKDVMKPLREKEARLKTPVVDTGDANINAHVINTQEQAERQLAESGLEFANKHLDDYVSDNILNEFKTATAKGAAAESVLSKASPFAYMAAGKAYNEALDPDKLLKHLQEKANADIAKVLSQPKMQEEIGLKAAAYGISPEEYVEKSLIPGLQAKLAADFDKSELSRSMPKSTAEYILRGVNESMRGTIMSMGMTSKKQRQYAQQGMAMTDNGENPDVNPGMAARVARGILGFVADAPVFGAAGKAGAAVAGKVFGNGVAQAARIANSTLGGRIARMAGSGMVSQGVTGVLYGSTNAAVQNYSTGDDTSIGNTVKLMTMGGLSEGASWATMGGIGGAVGAGIYNVSGVKRIPAKAFQLAMEGIGMHIGGNVAKTIEGHDTDWTSIEGNLEACANVVALKLTHARLPKRQSKDGIKESYLDMVARNINGLMTSDGQRAAFGGYTFTNEEKEQLFGSASAPKRTEALYGYDVHDNPLTRKESLTSWAMRAKKTAAKGKGEESYKDTDAEFVKTAYDEIMADNTIPWDTKAKFSALVMGTVPSARPMMENCRIEGGSVNEYSKNGELLSKNSFKSIDERNSIIYSLNMKREDQRLSNAYGAAQIKDEKTAQATLEAVAEANGMTAEQLKAAMDKQPLRRSEEEQNACVALRKAYEDEQFAPGTLHAEQSDAEGKDVVEENNLGTETPNNEAVAEVLGDLTKTEDALQAAMDGNDVLKEEYERMQKAGMSNPQIYLELFNSGLTQEQLAPLADYINALSKAQGMFKGTQDKIVETTQKHVGQWSYKGELNGEKQNGEQMVFVKDNKGRLLIVGAGDVAFDGEGRVRDGDMLTVYDPATREMDFVHAKDVTLEHTATSEEYAKDYQRQLEELNSTVYAEAQQRQSEKGKVKREKSDTKPLGEEGNEASLGLSKPTKPLGEKETEPVGEEPVATFADGTPVPMMKDSKGRETADYSQMSPEQGAEWIEKTFGEDAEAVADGKIERAKKALSKAEKMKIDMTADDADVLEAKAKKKAAIEAAKKELEVYTNIKKAMTEKKVKAGMEKSDKPHEASLSLTEPKGEGEREAASVRMQKADGYSEFADKHGLDDIWLARYAEAMEEKNPGAANTALSNLKVLYLREHTAEKKALMEREGVHGLIANKRLFEPIRNAIKEQYGDVDALVEERRKQVEQKNNMMEAARKRAEEEQRKREARLEELAELTDEDIDNRYAEALAKGDEAAAREMLDEAARRKGYGDADSDYQGVGAWSAPSKPDYETDEARRNAVGEDSPDLNVEDMAAGYNNQPEDIFLHPNKYSQGLPTSEESGKAIQTAIDDIRNGKKGVKIKVYRAVPTSVKEGKLRNGDWVTPSKKYAEIHGDNRLDGKYRIIEDEVPVSELWWDGNDVNEWGYDNGKSYRYKNVKNNRKLNDLVTRDDKGNVIPPSKRFNQRKADERYHRVAEVKKPSKAEVALRDAVIDRLRESGMDVITDEAEGQRVLDEANGKVRQMSFGEPYDYETYPLGRVEPNLSEKEVRVVEADADHGFANYKEAKAWAKEHVSKVYDNAESGGKGEVRISNAAIDKFMSQSAIDKSDSKDVHMAVLKVLPEVLKTSIDVETHPDFLKGEDGKRRAENGINKDVLVHRCYGAVSIDGKPYRVKITLKENVKTRETTHTHSYEATKIELLAGQHGDVTMTSPRNSNSSKQIEQRRNMVKPEGDNPNTNNSISAAKLLENVGMSYNSGEKVLDASKKRSEGVRFFRTANGEAYGFTVGGKIYIDPKIATSETPVHEYAHLWAEALRNGNSKEWKNVVELMKDTKVWDEVKARYTELKSDGDIADEVIATYSGRRGAERLREELRKITEGNGGVYEKIKTIGAFEKVKMSLDKFWKGVADFLHIHYTSAEEVADRVMKDLLEGVDPRGSEKRKVKSEKSNGNPRFQFIGEKGAAEADHAEEVSVRLDNLSVARDMEAEKKDAKAIKMATGWERGADGKWRYEIADMNEFDRNGNLLYRKHHPDYARYIELQDKELKNLFEDGEELTNKEREEYEALSKKYESDKFGGEKLDNNHTLEAYVDAPELFKAYPELRNVRMTFMDTGGDEIASYHHISSVFEVDKDDVGEIVVNTGKVSANTRTNELKSVVLHEMQHAIQDMEGFARGGNTERMKSDFLEAKAEWAARAYAHELEETAKALGEDYDQLGVERALIKEYEDMGMSDELPDKDTRIKGFNYFARGYADRSLDDAIKRFRLNESTRGDFNPYIEYSRLAGEVEARNVQKRMDMSAEERRASLAAETEDVAREDQIFLMRNGVDKPHWASISLSKPRGKDVMENIKHAAEAYNKAKAHYRMELGNTFSDSKEHFDAVRDRAVKEKGIVMPNLNKEKVKVVEVEKHGFEGDSKGAIEEARAWAKENLVTTDKQDLPTMRDGTPYTISKKAVDKYLSSSAVSKSDELGIHLSVLPKLKDVIHESIEAEIHPDYKKGEDGIRGIENGYGEGVLVHRLYGTVEIDGKMYRVKTTMQEFRGGEENKPHSYEVTKIELLDAPGTAVLPDSSPLDTTPSNSKNITSEGSEKANESDSLPLNIATNGYISTAKLLQGVEKSYDSGKKLLDESKDLTDGETFFRKESDKPNEASLGLSKPLNERIGKAIDKAAEKTGGKVKMVNSVEEIGNEQVRRDIENGKQVTGWYDEKTGEVHLYMPNIHDSYTAEKTVWHETVGHKGMRGLLGDKFKDYMRGLWLDLDNPINAELRAYVKERMKKDSMGFYDAIEEFIAESAEKGKGEPGFWNYIKNKVTDALHEIGYRISPNVKDVKYMLWLAKNVQKKGNDPWWKMRADAVKWKIEHENVEYTKIHGGEFYENDGKNHDFEDMTKEEWDEATDGQIHYRTAPSAATALDRYHSMLNAHGYMATEAFMDNMLSLEKLMKAVDPSIKKIEDVKSSMNPYVLQNTMQGAMSDKMTLFEHKVMKPLDKAMSDVLDSFAGKNTEEKIRECNLYMIGKHGLERNRVLFVRDKIREKRKVKSEESDSIDALEAAWNNEKSDLGQKLRSGQIDLREYYRQMDEWIVQNIDKDFKAEEHDYSGMHGLQEIDDLKSPYDDAGAIDSVMSQEAKMESQKKGSVDNLWKRIKDATNYSINSDYENGLMSEELRDRVRDMFDWYVPLRKYDEATAEDIYGYISGEDGKGFIGETLMNAKGRKSLSDVNVLAQIGAMANRAIRNGGQNAVKQAFARFVRNSGEQNLVKETKVWVEKKGTDTNGNDIWEEAYPQIPDNANAHDIATIVDAFETDMKTKQANGEAKTLSNSTDIGFKFARAKNKSEHFVDVKIAGRTHRFVVLGNPRAAQALNGMLENSSPNSYAMKKLKAATRFMAQMATSYAPEFVMRNIIRDAEFASNNVTAKEGTRYGLNWARYYAELNPLNVFYNEGAGALKSLKWKDLKEGVGIGLYARYREGTLGNSKMERYFKEFMQNGGETGWVQVKTMQEWEKEYKRDVSRERSNVAKAGKMLRNFLVGNVENLNEVAENMARFATFCTSRDLGRSAVRSAYDAKQVSTNFNRHGSGDAIKTFKNGEMGAGKEMRRNVYGSIASYLRNYSMFFNAGVQSTHLLMSNVKNAPIGTVTSMMSMPFGLGLIAALANNAMIASEDEKKRKGVKDPYGELPEYIRRNNLCIYKGGGEFVTIPLAIELRAFYGLGDLAAGLSVAKNVKSTRNVAMDAVGCMSQLLPVADYMNGAAFDKEPGKETLKGVLPTAAAPFVEWWLNSDWKGSPIRREGDYTENRPAWMNAYSGTPEKLMDLNKWVNAETNDVAPGNENMRGNSLLDEATDPAMLNHIIGTLGGGAATFITRGTGLVLKYADGREQEIETKDIPFLRSLMYTPSEQTSMARTKAKWYGYKESMEKNMSNYSLLKNKNVPLTERIRNAADRHRFEQSADYARIRIIKDAEKQMKRWNKMKRLNADDKKQVDFANKNIEMIMQKAVEQMDKVSND